MMIHVILKHNEITLDTSIIMRQSENINNNQNNIYVGVIQNIQDGDSNSRDMMKDNYKDNNTRFY